VSSGLEPRSTQLSFRLEKERKVFDVSELNAAIRDVFTLNFRDIWVAGEVSGCKNASSGHLYFSLKDKSGQIRCVLFKGTARWLKFRPQDGIQVLARGSVEVYEPRGEYQLIVEQLELQGAGALQFAFEQLKKKLEVEGLFAATRKKPLPRLPGRIGIVTSPSGAVIRDILHVLRRRFPGLHIRLYPSLVQGEGSADQVSKGLEFFSAGGWAEVVIVARGGGSLEDLWTFNEERVARAIAACSVPVISAIGHEADFTIADFVADLRAPTPSAAAELVICTRDSLLELIAAARDRLFRATRYRILMAGRELEQRGVGRAQMVFRRLISKRSQQVDECDFALRAAAVQIIASSTRRLHSSSEKLHGLDLRVRFARAHGRLAGAEAKLLQLLKNALWEAQRAYEPLNAHLTQLSPLAVLGRGYAIVLDDHGHAIRSVEETEEGANVRILLHKGKLEATVDKVDRS